MKLTKQKIETLANEIVTFLKANEMWDDVCIYYNNKRIRCKSTWNHKTCEFTYEDIIEEDMNPFDYFEYANPYHILSMSFEGSFYEAMNYSGYKVDKFEKILKKYNLYYELGQSWNLSTYPINDEDYNEIEFTSYKVKPEPMYLYQGMTDNIDPQLRRIMNLWYKLSEKTGDKGSCVVNAGFNFTYKDSEYFMSACSPWQGELSWTEHKDIIKSELEFIGATDIKYDWGRMD